VQVQVGLCDTTGMRLDQIEEIQEESAALFLPAAVELVWWDAPESCSEPPPENGLPFVQVYVLGELLPSIRELYPSHQAARILGVTLGKAGNVPGSVIHLSKTAVNTMARLPSGNVVSRTLTRAMGRVLAHELAHWLLADRQHTERGLLKPVLTRDDLIYAPRDVLTLSPAQTEHLRRASRINADSVAGSRP